MIKSIKTKLKFTALAAFFVTLICCVFIAFAGLGNGSKTANATATGASYALGANGSINKSGYDGLLHELLKTNGPTSYKMLKDRMDGLPGKVMTGSSINTNVTLGGETWNVVYASETRTGEVIVTLWLAESTDTQQWHNSGSASSECAFPSNMYSTSFVRSYLTGSFYAYYTIAIPTEASPATLERGTQATAWANFLADYGNYIVAPTEVAYQETESWGFAGNEAYGTPADVEVPQDLDYSSKPGYNNWQYDKLWLPSGAETKSIWEISETVCGNTTNSWLRSTDGAGSDYACYCDSTGVYARDGVTISCAVRPALHLNLAKISKEFEEQDTSLATAWNNAVEESLQTGEQVTFTLEKDWYATPDEEFTTSFGEGTGFTEGGIYVPAGANIKLDLNGHKIDRNLKTAIYSGRNIYVLGSLELCDGASGGIITGGNSSFRGGGIWVDQGSLTLNGGKITGNTAGLAGGVYCTSGTFIMNGGEISGNTAINEGGGSYCLMSTFIMNGGKISGNSGSYGGALHLNNDTVTMNGGEISDNTASESAGGVSMNGGTVFTMNRGKVSSNTARSNGGAFQVVQRALLEINDGEISGNNSANMGGAIYMSGSTVELNGGTISGNTSTNGGGIEVYGKITMNGGTITGNKSSNAGGGICFGSGSSMEMYGGTISENIANAGGGLYLYNTNTVTMYGGTISGNTAQRGAGICLNYYTGASTFTMFDGTISGNTATNAGGGVCVQTGCSFTMHNGTISDNKTVSGGTYYGGGVYILQGSFTMHNGNILNNFGIYGGGVAVNQGTFIMDDGTIDGNTAEGSGGGVYLNKGTFTMAAGTISDNTAEHSYGSGIFMSESTFTMDGGTNKGNNGTGIYIESGTFTMNAGVISNNSTGVDIQGRYLGGGQSENGTFTMNGGTITGNTYRGVDIGEYGVFNLGGGVISDNKNSGAQCNVHLYSTTTINITGRLAVAGKNATRVGVSPGASVGGQPITSGYTTAGNNVSNIYKFFFADYDNNYLRDSSGEVTINVGTTTISTITWGYRSGGSAIPVDGNYFSVEYTGASYTIEKNSSETIQYAVDENGATVGTTVSKVGKYYFTLANAENYTNPTFTFEILPQSIENAEISVVSTYVYCGEEIIPELRVTLGGTRLAEGVDFTATYSNNVNAGTANVVILGTGNYKGMAKGTFEIAKRNLNIRWGNTEAEYSGSTKSVKAVAEGLLDGDTVKINLTYSQNGKTVAPVNAGEYTVTAAITSDNYVLATGADITSTLTIKPAYVAAVWSGDNYVYSGEEQAPAASYTNAYGTVIPLGVTVEGSPVNAGEYTATATAEREDANYVLTNLTHKFNILKAAAEISWSGNSFTFDGSAKTPTAAVTGNGEDLSASVTLAYFKNGVQLDGAPVNAGGYVVKATLTHENYELAASEYSFVIGAANMTVNSVYADTVFTGEGKAPEITATANGNELEIKVTYAAAGSDRFTEELPVNVGSYVAKVAEVNGNFNEGTVPFEITAASVAVVWSLDGLSVKAVTQNKTTYQWLYDGKAHAPVATATFGGAELELTVDGISAIGTYTVTAQLKNTAYNKNFTLTDTTANVEIVRSAISEVRWYENGASEPLAAGETPSYKYIEVYGENGPKLSAYGAATLTGVDDAGAEITVTALIPMNVTYSEFVRNGFWAAREEAYNANASLSGAFAPHCDMRATDTSIKFFVTDLTEDEDSADVRWVVEVDGAFVAVENYEFIYNGNVQSPKAIVVLDAEKFEADPTDLTSFAYLPVGGERTNAGTYYAYILPCRYLISEDDAECLYTIKPLDVTVTWQVGEYTYNGTAQAPAARVSGTGGLQCNVTVAGFVNAGTHVATAVVDKNFNIISGATQEFTIEKLTLAADRVEWNCDESGAKREEDFFVWNYDGELHLPTATMKVRINGENVDVTLAVTGSASSVGTHYAFAILANTDKNNSNFAFAGARARFDIVLDTISHIYWSDEDAQGKILYTYDGEAHLPTAYYMNGDVRVDLTVIGERTEAGTYIAYVTDNFDFAVSTRHEFTILPQPLNVVWSRVEVDYTGAEQRPVVRFTDEEGETVYLSAEEYAVTGFIGAGEYTAEIFSLNGNYTFVNSTNDYTIKAIEVTLTWLGNDDGTFEWEYDGEKHVPSVSHNADVTVTVIGGESGVGKYTAVAVCDNENYVITNATQVFEIKPFEITVNWTVGNYTYDGENYFKPTATYVDMNGDEQELIVNGARVDAGEYTAEAVLPENCAFKFESGENAGTHGFTINRLLLTEISWTGNEDGSFVWEFDGETHCPVATAGTVKIAITGGAVNAGKYVAKAEPANVGNYAFAEGVEVEKAFEITPKTVDVKWYGENGSEDDDFVWEYDGTLRAPTAKFEGADGLVSVPVNGATANSGEHQAIAIDVFNNYEFSKLTSTQRFRINGKEVTAVWVAGDNGTYNEADKVYEYVFNGKAQQPTASAEGVQFAYTIKNAAGEVVSAAISAGEYTVTVTATNKNFTVSAESETVKVSVKAKKVTVQWGNLTLDYTGAAQVPEAWFTDANNQLVKLEVSGEKTEAGEDYEVTASFKNATGNYELEGDVTNTFSIVKSAADEVYWDWATNGWKVKTTEPDPEPETPDGN